MNMKPFGKRGIETGTKTVIPEMPDQAGRSRGMSDAFARRFAKIAGTRPVDVATRGDQEWKSWGGSD